MAVKYPANVNAYVEQPVRDEIERIVGQGVQLGYGLSLSDVIREAIEAGLPIVRKKYARGRTGSAGRGTE